MQDIYITYSCNFMDATKISGFFTLMMGFENSDFSGNPHLSAKLTTLNNIYSLLNSSFFFPLIISANLYHHIMPKWNTCVLFCLHFHQFCFCLVESLIYQFIVDLNRLANHPHRTSQPLSHDQITTQLNLYDYRKLKFFREL